MRTGLYLYMLVISTAALLYGGSIAFGQPLAPPIPAGERGELPLEPMKQVEAEATIQLGVAPEYPAYNLNIIKLSGGANYDVLIFTLYNNNLYIINTIETKNKGEFVFTGPPGKYSIRISAFEEGKGFTSTTATTVIKPAVGQPVPPSPTDPVTPPPVDPGNPSTGPPAEGKFGIGLVAYDWLVKNRPGNAAAVKQLAANYEWASAAPQITQAIATELSKRNEAVYASDPTLKGLKDAIRAIATRHVETGIMSTEDDFRTAYKETAVGIRAAYGK